MRLSGPFMQVGRVALAETAVRYGHALKVKLDAFRQNARRALHTTLTHTERPANHAQSLEDR